MTCYPPSEDTYLLEEAIKDEKGHLAIEVGTSTGYLSLSICENFDWLIATDIAFECLEIFKEEMKKKGIHNIDLIATDLLSPLKDNVADLIFFNPPYLPRDGYTTNIDSSTLYQEKDRNIIDEFLKEYKNKLKEKGRCYLVVSSLTNIHAEGFEVLKKKKFFFEEIFVLRFASP